MVKIRSMSEWWVYIIEKRGKLYVGITTHLNNRLRQHGNPPLLYRDRPMSTDEAVSREKTLKCWSRAKKEAPVSGDMGKLRDLSKHRKR
jgi:predicted GIY-YIG superfamily endonuclease